MKSLIGKEFSCAELDNEMQDFNYYSEYDVYDDELLDSRCIIYISKKDNESQARIEFEVSIRNSADEIPQASYLIVKDIDL